MSRRLLSVGGMTALLTLSACSSGGASPAPSVAAPSQAAASPAPASQAPASQAPASQAPATAAGGPCAPSSATATVAVTIADFAFPSTIDAKVGDVIGFTNKDSAPHTATLDDDSCTTDSLAQGASGGLTFSAAGDYPFHCRIHPKMVATIKVAG